jgi:hypothetical protein
MPMTPTRRPADRNSRLSGELVCLLACAFILAVVTLVVFLRS